MKRLIACMSTVALALASSAVLGAVGRTPGSFAVSPTGAATYGIPIWVPAGPRGVQPNLAITYNSHAGSSTLGPGWGISGLSSITRCGKTTAQDGAPSGVTLTSSDALCLDGKRLRTYGSTGDQYQTEIADFSLVTANGTQGNAASFVVIAKNGWTYEYGNGGNSRVLASDGSTAIAWMLDKITDRSNNRIVFTYLPPDANLVGETLPDEISWTASGHGTSTFNYKIKFHYVGNNPQGTTNGYFGGTPVMNADLLTSIEISSLSVTKKKYVFGYELSPTTSSYRLKHITECADSGETDCLGPTTVTWQDGQAGIATSASGSYGLAEGDYLQYGIRLLDANGDGYLDRFYRSGGAWYVAFGSASGFDSGHATGAPAGSTFAAELFGDVLGNGRTGILSNVSGTWYYYWWNGSAFTSASTGTAVNTAATTYLADGNGDGRADLFEMTYTAGPDSVTPGGTALSMRASTGTGSSPSFAGAVGVYGSGSYFNSALRPQFANVPLDFNGDGREDLMMTGSVIDVCVPENPLDPNDFNYNCTYTSDYIALVSQADGSYAEMLVGAASNESAVIPRFANWNNDGCTDIVYATQVIISKCSGVESAAIPINSQNALGALDWDGDGRADLLVQNGSTIGVRLSTGTGISTTVIDTGIPYSNAILSSCAIVFTFDIDGDGLDDLGCLSGSANTLTYYRHNGPTTLPNLVSSISDGFGIAVSPSYVSLSHADSSVYDATRDASYPYKDYNGPYYVVSSYTATDGTGIPDTSHDYTVNYRYSSAWVDNTGRGFSGFNGVRAIDSRNSLQAYQYYWRDFPYTGMVREEHVYQANGTTDVSQIVNERLEHLLDSTANNERHFPYVSRTTRKRWEVGGAKNGLLVTTASTDFTLDLYGNATNVAETITDNDASSPYSSRSWTSTTSTIFQSPDLGNWCFTLPASITVTRTAPGVSGSIVRSAEFPSPDYVKCRVTHKTTEPSSSIYAVAQVFDYDDFGNINSVTTTGIGMPARVSSVDWGTTGQFPVSSTNALNETTGFGYDYGVGLQTSVTDPNQVVSSVEYDTFGRRTTAYRADGTKTTWSYATCDTTCFNSASALAVTETVVNVGGSTLTDSLVYLDRFGRSLATQTRLLDGSYQRVETQYDSLGRVSEQAAPCNASSCTYYWTTFSYDALNRTTQIQRPENEGNSNILQTTSIEYAGRSTKTTDPQSKTSTILTSVVGTLLRSEDNDGYYQDFLNDAFGSLRAVTDSASNALFSATYDYGIGAFQRTTSDTDLGPRSYTYNALGELVNYSDNNGHSFTVTYDALSRPYQRFEPDLTTTYFWGSSATDHNIDQLEHVTATSAAGTYAEAFTYDGIGRPSGHTITIPSDTPSDYTYGVTYDATTGLPDTLTYPADSAGRRLKLRYAYANGLLQKVSDYNSPNTDFWTANTTNVAGQVTQETLGNGVVTVRAFDAVTGQMSSVQSGLGSGAALQNESYLYDLVGNVTQRQNNNVGLTETFYYDNLYRLEHSTLGATTNLALTYYPNGNIKTHSNLANGAIWTYDASRQHAVTQAGNSTYAYTYDGNGNVTGRTGYAITWTSFDHPAEIDGAGSESVQFAYNQDHLRWRAMYSGAAGTETTYFIGDALEKVVTVGLTDYRHFIKVGGNTVAIYSRTDAGAVTVRYVLHDHLGSVAGILNSDGTTYVKESFTAFGERRNQCTWSGPATQGTKDKIAAVTRHGYTWQTALADMGLNDMNGRIQDAVTGRFLSADPYVSDPANTQNFNRYSYALNNPLTYTDPSGFDVYVTAPRDQGGFDGDPLACRGNELSGPCAEAKYFFHSQVLLDEQQESGAMAALASAAAAAQAAGDDKNPDAPNQTVVVTGDKPRPQGHEPGTGNNSEALFARDFLAWLFTPEPDAFCSRHKCYTGSPDLVGGVSKVGQIAKAEEVAAATKVAEDAVRLHHAWPKYLGGAVEQDLVPLSKSLHDAFHSGLDKILPRQWGTAYYESLSPAAKQQLIRDLAAYTQAFDAKYGTQLYDAMIRNGFPGP